MMQQVLVDRFRFAAHRAIRELPVYELVVAKGGPKLEEAAPGDSDANGLKDARGHTPLDHMRVGFGSVDCQAVPMTSLIEILMGLSGRTVVDKTGLEGRFNFTLKFRVADVGASGDDSNAPELPAALQEQLGLKLVPENGPVKVVVIDHIERPTEN